MRRWALALLVMISTAVIALPATTASPSSCFAEHLHEAMTLNRERAPVYERLSDGESRALSRRLIAGEVLSLLIAYPLEAWASVFWRYEIPILCRDFVPMAVTPPVQSTLTERRPDLTLFHDLDVDLIADRAREALATGGFLAAHAVLEQEIVALAAEPAFHCMSRHLLESAARVAWLAPQYDALAELQDVALTPSLLSRVVFELHLQSLRLGRDLDGRAAPLAADGLAIICGDVPAIDFRPSL